MCESEISKCLNDLFSVIISESESKSKKITENILNDLKKTKLELTDPEMFNSLLMFKLKNSVRFISKDFYEVSKNVKNKEKPSFVFLNYDFLDNNIEQLCTLREGHGCSADKSRFILQMYLEYLLSGELSEFHPAKKKYWIPNFGTSEDWIALCDGLYDLYYGKPEKYIIAYGKLIQSTIKTFKYLQHTWYVKFVDGEVIKYGVTFDDNQENPLDNEFKDKGSYYELCKKDLEHKNYELKGTNGFDRMYVKVPKSDIAEIYKISEEVMI